MIWFLLFLKGQMFQFFRELNGIDVNSVGEAWLFCEDDLE